MALLKTRWDYSQNVKTEPSSSKTPAPYQVNVQVPTNAPRGNAVAVAISVGGVASSTVLMAVQ